MEKLPKVLYHGAGAERSLLVPDYEVGEQKFVATSADRNLAILKGFKLSLGSRHCVISMSHHSGTLLIVLSPNSSVLSRIDLKQTKMWLYSLPFEGAWQQSAQHPSCWFNPNQQHLFLDKRELILGNVYRGERYVIKHPHVGETEGTFT